MALYRIFAESGLPKPRLKVDVQMSAARQHLLWAHDLLLSISAGMQPDDGLAALGDLETLGDRLEAEARSMRTAVASITVIGAASRLP